MLLREPMKWSFFHLISPLLGSSALTTGGIGPTVVAMPKKACVGATIRLPFQACIRPAFLHPQRLFALAQVIGHQQWSLRGMFSSLLVALNQYSQCYIDVPWTSIWHSDVQRILQQCAPLARFVQHNEKLAKQVAIATEFRPAEFVHVTMCLALMDFAYGLFDKADSGAYRWPLHLQSYHWAATLTPC